MIQERIDPSHSESIVRKMYRIKQHEFFTLDSGKDDIAVIHHCMHQ